MASEAAPRGAGERVQLIWGIGAIVISAALATWAAWPIYETWRIVLVTATGLLIGVGSVVLGRALRWRWWWTGLTAFGAYTVLVVPVAIPSALTSPAGILRGIAAGIAGIVVGWKQLLTVSLPAGDYQAVLVPFLVVVTLGSLVATALVVAGGRWAGFAVVPMLAMTAFGAVFGTAVATPELVLGPFRIPSAGHVLIGTLAIVVAITWLLGRARLARAQSLRLARSRASTVRQGGESTAIIARRYLLGAILVVVALLVGAVVAPLGSAFGPRDALRESVDPLLVLRQQPSPLSGYRAAFTAAQFSEELFRVSAPDTVDRIRIATLDDYDGESFGVGDSGDDRFRRIPRTSPADAPLQVTIGAAYAGVWVPVAVGADAAPLFSGPRAEALADGYYANPELGGAVVVSAEGASGLRPGDSYRLEVAPPPDVSTFSGANGGDSLLVADDYPALDAWVELQDVPRTGAGLQELVDRLRARGYLSHATRDDAAAADWIAELASRASYTFFPARSGHSTARVEELFTSLLEQQQRAGEDVEPELLVSAVGDDEQFATAAALLARHLGFESRVVVGVRLGGGAAELGVQPCDEVCTGSNLTAWAEARIPGGDWAPLDATPQFEVTPSIIRAGEEPPKNPTVPEQPASEALEPPSAESDDSSSASSEETAEDGWWLAVVPVLITIGLSVATLVLLVLPFLVFPVSKAVRRRWRRRAPVPEVSMVGAWDELIDSYVDNGIEVPRGFTRTEIADAVGRPAAATLAAVVDRAVFAEHPPGRDASAATWDILDAERRDVAGGGNVWRRFRAALTPASLIDDVRASELISDTLTRIRRKDAP